MAALGYGLSSAGGTKVTTLEQDLSVQRQGQVIYSVALPATTNAAQGWWFELPDGSTLISVFSFGADTTSQWTRVTGTNRYFLIFGVTGVKNQITVSVTPGSVQVQPDKVTSAGPIPRAEARFDLARVIYGLPSFTMAEQTAIQNSLLEAIRLPDNDANKGRLWALFKTALKELETYCSHSFVQRTFTSRCYFYSSEQGIEVPAYIQGSWRELYSLSRVTASDGSLPPVHPSGIVTCAAGVTYTGTFVLGPYDGPESGLSDEVMEAITRLVGYRWDGGIFQTSALSRSGALDAITHYVNRDARMV